MIAFGCNIFATTLCASIALVVFMGVFFRYVLNMPLSWGEEIPKYFMVWMTFIGAPVVLYHGGHISLDSWHNRLRPRVRRIIRFIINFICCCLLTLMISYGWNSALMASQQKMILVGGASMFWVYLAIPVGSLLFLVMLILQGINELAHLIKGD